MILKSVLGDDVAATYTAPIIANSLLPPLLGNRTLRRMQAVLDCGSGKLIIPGPGGIEVKMNPGSNVFDLEFTDSGHWVLPLQTRGTSNESNNAAAKDELSFAMSCRRDESPNRTPSPKRQNGARAEAGSN